MGSRPYYDAKYNNHMVIKCVKCIPPPPTKIWQWKLQIRKTLTADWLSLSSIFWDCTGFTTPRQEQWDYYHDFFTYFSTLKNQGLWLETLWAPVVFFRPCTFGTAIHIHDQLFWYQNRICQWCRKRHPRFSYLKEKATNL